MLSQGYSKDAGLKKWFCNLRTVKNCFEGKQMAHEINDKYIFPYINLAYIQRAVDNDLDKSIVLFPLTSYICYSHALFELAFSLKINCLVIDPRKRRGVFFFVILLK